jgi:hypothetical protein
MSATDSSLSGAMRSASASETGSHSSVMGDRPVVRSQSENSPAQRSRIALSHGVTIRSLGGLSLVSDLQSGMPPHPDALETVQPKTN